MTEQAVQATTEPCDTETNVLRTLCGAADDLEAAIAETRNGLLADHCENALREVRNAMLSWAREVKVIEQNGTTPDRRLPADVSETCHGKRLDHYLNQYGGKSDGTQARMASRAQAFDLAHNAATAEMLDEIHMMLRIMLVEGKR